MPPAAGASHEPVTVIGAPKRRQKKSRPEVRLDQVAGFRSTFPCSRKLQKTKGFWVNERLCILLCEKVKRQLLVPVRFPFSAINSSFEQLETHPGTLVAFADLVRYVSKAQARSDLSSKDKNSGRKDASPLFRPPAKPGKPRVCTR
jgi:hypothetical protein